MFEIILCLIILAILVGLICFAITIWPFTLGGLTFIAGTYIIAKMGHPFLALFIMFPVSILLTASLCSMDERKKLSKMTPEQREGYEMARTIHTGDVLEKQQKIQEQHEKDVEFERKLRHIEKRDNNY